MCSQFGFSIRQFFICLFYCLEMAFICKFQYTHLFFSQCSTLLVDVRFCRQVSNSPRNKISMRFIPYLLKKWFFWPPRLCCPPRAGKKTFPSTLNLMILQMVRNESLRFGGHVDIQVSYEIIWLKVQKRPQFCTLYLALNRGCFEAILMKNTPRTLGVKNKN
jgi:hypothetical protein